MNTELTIDFDWERLEQGSPEERSCFGMLRIQFGGALLTEGQDGFVERLRSGPFVSGYHLAEWLAWNWWRLTTEPRPDDPTSDWRFTHGMATVGAGYLWPNLTIYSDRQRTALIAKPTRPHGCSAFRFTADWTAIIPTTGFISALDLHMTQIQGKLRADGVELTNFDRIWAEVLEERADPERAYYRQIEAALGQDADEADDSQIRELIADASSLGRDAVIELSAGNRSGRVPATAAEIRSWATEVGEETRFADVARISGLDIDSWSDHPAWELGYRAAQRLRDQHDLGQEPLANSRLAELSAVKPAILEPERSAPLAFCLDDGSAGQGRIVLRSRYPTGRRFELARLLGDRLTAGLDEPLLPVTRSHTYRQQVQRAFAAELLCPFEALETFLEGDYSEQARDDAAEYFEVSERAVRSHLVNHKRLVRDALEDDSFSLELTA